jgi:sulfur carrier protein
MKLTLNGKPKELPDVMSLEKAIAYWQPEAEKFAVAVNGEFVARENYADTLLQANDQVELLSPIAGG